MRAISPNLIFFWKGFVAAGAKVYISSRSVEACEKVAAELSEKGPGKCISLPADLQKLDEVKRLVRELSEKEDRKWAFAFQRVYISQLS